MTDIPAPPVPVWLPAHAVAAVVRPQEKPPAASGEAIPFELDYGSISGASNEERIEVSGGVKLSSLDLRLAAEYITFDRKTYRIEAAGNVVLTRGDERLETDALTLELMQGKFVAERVVAVSPPLYIAGDRLERYAGGVVATNALITLCPEGKGEFLIRARQVDVVDGEYAVVRGAGLYLFNKRLLGIRRYKFPLTPDRDRQGSDLPLTARMSRISGLVLGLGSTFTLAPRTEAQVRVEFPTQRGVQYGVTVRRDFLGDLNLPPDPRRVGLLGARPETGQSSLRQLLTARTIPRPDAVLDYQTIFSIADPLARPTQGLTPELRAEATFSGNEEVGNKRQGNLLVSRQPEARVSGRVPLGTPVTGRDETALRASLRKPRVTLIGDFRAGEYRERRLQQDQATVEQGRVSATVGVGTLPWLLGERLLVRPQFTYTHIHYQNDQTYRYLESGLAASYIFGPRTYLGAEVLRRDISGATPFTFDEIDTQDEARLRFQAQSGRYTFGLLGRYDLQQGRLFDYEFALAVRGRCIEPRIAYQKLGSRLNFGVNLVGF